MKKMNRKVRAVVSVILTFFITVACIAITTCIEAKTAWLNSKNLQNSISSLGYANKSIEELEVKVSELLSYYGIKTDGLSSIINEDKLYSVFLNNEKEVLSTGQCNQDDSVKFKADLTEYVDGQLEGIYLSDDLKTSISDIIDESVHIYNNYMHSEFFKSHYDFVKEYSKKLTSILVIAIVVLMVSIALIILMYQYIRHSLKFVVCALVPAIIANLAIAFYVGNAGWVADSGIEPKFYRELITLHCGLGRQIGIAISAIEALIIVLLTARINKSKKNG